MGAASSLPTPLRLLWRQPTPFDVVSGREATAETTKARLMATSRAVEGRALLARDSDLVVATFQHRRHYTAASRRRYEALATTGASVVVMATGLGVEQQPGRPREVALAPTDGLVLEWDILVIGSRSSYAFAAREVDVPGLPDAARRFTWAVTHDPALVKEAALALVGRVPGLRVPGTSANERL